LPPRPLFAIAGRAAAVLRHVEARDLCADILAETGSPAVVRSDGGVTDKNDPNEFRLREGRRRDRQRE